MAVLNGMQLQGCEGGVINPWLTSAVDEFDGIVGWPLELVDVLGTPSNSFEHRWPIEANPREIQGVVLNSYEADFYDRIHIAPQELALGNVVSTQRSTVWVWNAHRSSRTLNEITGLDEGLELTGQASPPLLFAPFKEREWDLSVTPQGQPVLDARITWRFQGGEQVALHVTANRIIGWTFTPDWADGITERLTWATDILASESGVEQRRAIRLAPRREFTAPVYAEGRERQLLDLALYGWGARIWALPIWPDIQLLAVDVPAGAGVVPCTTEHLDFAAGGLAMFRAEDAFTSETVEVVDVLVDGLQLKRPTLSAWPAGSRLYPVRSAQLTSQPELTRLTDRLSSLEVSFLVVEPCDWPAVAPSESYRGRPLFSARPDETEDLSRAFQRLLLTLDNGAGLPLTVDTADRGFSQLGHRWLELGRAERAQLRSFLYYMNGRQRAVWVPTHAEDLQLAARVPDGTTVIDVENVGYTRFSGGRPGRRDIYIQFHDGNTLIRRITGATELSPEVERLSLNASLGREVWPEEVARISWLSLCRLDGDAVEIEHQTDSEGVGACSFVFREVRDDEL